MTIPKGIESKALTLGVSIETTERRRGFIPPERRYQFRNKQSVILTGWLTLAQAHRWLDNTFADSQWIAPTSDWNRRYWICSCGCAVAIDKTVCPKCGRTEPNRIRKGDAS